MWPLGYEATGYVAGLECKDSVPCLGQFCILGQYEMNKIVRSKVSWLAVFVHVRWK